MASENVLSLLLTARYIGAPAFRALDSDINRLMHSTSTLEGVGRAMQTIGDIMVSVGLAATGMAVAVTKTAADYEAAVNRMVATGALLPSQVKSMSDTFMQVAEKYGMDSTQIAQGSYFALSQLQTVAPKASLQFKEQLIQELGAYTEASGAGQPGSVDFTKAAQDALRVLVSMRLPTSQWGAGLGDMTLIENMSGLSQDQLVKAMLRSAPVASSLGLSFSDLVAAQGALATGGVPGARAGTELASGLQHIITNTTALKQLSQLGIDPNSLFNKSGQLKDINTFMATIWSKTSGMSVVKRDTVLHNILGAVGEKAFLELNNQMGLYQTLKKAESGDTQAAMFARALTMSNSLLGSFLKLKAALLDLMKVIGAQLGPVLTPIVDKLTAAFVKLRLALESMNPQQAQALVKGVALTSTVGMLGGGLAMRYGGTMLQAYGRYRREQGAAQAEAQGAFQQSLDKWLNSRDKLINSRQSSGLAAWEGEASAWNSRQTSIAGRLEALTRSKESIAAANEGDLNALFGEYNTSVAVRRAKLTEELAGYEKKYGKGTPGYIMNMRKANGKYASDVAMFKRNYQVASGEAIAKHHTELTNVLQEEGKLKNEQAVLGAAPPALSNYMRPLTAKEIERELGPKPVQEAAAKNIIARLWEHGRSLPGKAHPFFSAIPGFMSGHFPIASKWASGAGYPGSNIFERGLGAAGGLVGDIGLAIGGHAKGFGRLMAKAFPTAAEWASGRAFPGANIAERGIGAVAGAGLDLGKHVATLGKKMGSLALGGAGKLIDLFKMLPGLLMKGAAALPGLIAGFAEVAIPVMLVVGAITVLVLAFTRYHTQAMAVVNYLKGVMAPVFQFFMGVVILVWHTIQSVWNSVSPQIDAAMTRLFTAIKQAGPIFQVLGFVVAGLAGLILVVVGGLVSGILSALVPVINFFTNIIGIFVHFFNFINDLIHGKWHAAWNDFLGIFGSALQAIRNILQIPIAIIQGFIGFVVGLFGSGAKKAIDSFINGVLFKIPVLGGLLHGIGQLVADFMGDGNSDPKKGPMKPHAAGAHAVKSFANGMGSQKPALVLQTQSMYQDMQNAMTNMQNEQQMYKAGQDIMWGFIKGVRSLNATLTATMDQVAANVQWTVRNALQTHSPSRVFHNIGQMTMQGYIEGVTSMSESVNSTMRNAVPTNLMDRQQMELSLALKNLQVDTLQVNNLDGVMGGAQQKDPLDTYYHSRAIQAQREENMASFNRRTFFDQTYRYNYQYTA